MAESNSGGSGGVAAVAIVVLVVLVVLVGGYLLIGRGGLPGASHTTSASITTPAGPITGKATTN
jgi:hypothetical protein